MKQEWKKQEKELYGSKTTPAIVKAAKQNYIMISGTGNPNDEEFSEKVSALFSLAYAIKMRYKTSMKGNVSPDVIDDFAVYPLEGIWKEKESDELVKDQLSYTIMIRQPDFITSDMVDTAVEQVKKKKPNPFYNDIRFDAFEDGTCIQILHIGSYDDEPASFEKMNEFARQQGYTRCRTWHREIYLTNGNRVIKSKLKTILRYVVE